MVVMVGWGWGWGLVGGGVIRWVIGGFGLPLGVAGAVAGEGRAGEGGWWPYLLPLEGV